MMREAWNKNVLCHHGQQAQVQEEVKEVLLCHVSGALNFSIHKQLSQREKVHHVNQAH